MQPFEVTLEIQTSTDFIVEAEDDQDAMHKVLAANCRMDEAMLVRLAKEDSTSIDDMAIYSISVAHSMAHRHEDGEPPFVEMSSDQTFDMVQQLMEGDIVPIAMIPMARVVSVSDEQLNALIERLDTCVRTKDMLSGLLTGLPEVAAEERLIIRQWLGGLT